MPSSRVRAEDALFLHAQTAKCPQQVGAVVMLNGPGVDLAGLRTSVATRVGQLPQLRRRLIPARGRWDRPRWVIDAFVDVRVRVTEITSDDGSLTSLERIVGGYFAEPVDPAEAAWQLMLVRAAADGPSAIVVKAHHALGDSYALITELSGLFDPPARPSGHGDFPAGIRGDGSRPKWEKQQREKRATSQGRRHPLRAGAVAGVVALKVVRGLAGMSLDPRPSPIAPGGVAGLRREFAAVSLDARMVATKARLLRAGTVDLVLGVAASALGQLIAGRGQPAVVGRTVRAMVPYSLRPAGRSVGWRGTAGWTAASGRGRGDGAASGNRTAGVLLDLPVGPMSLAERVTAVRAVRQARLRRGDADAAAFVLRAMNLLPPPLQRVIARTAFTSRRFSLIVSVFPGTRQRRQLLGAQVTEVFPVLALADGVGLALGAMTWGRSLSIGIMADPALIPDVAVLAAGIRDAFTAGESGPAS
jgi:diacylglycerol O-acyltransferase / wax synthase